MGTTTADTTNSTTDNAMTITGVSGSGSTIAAGTFTTPLDRSLLTSVVRALLVQPLLLRTDVTVNISSGGGTHAAITATDDIVIDVANTAATTSRLWILAQLPRVASTLPRQAQAALTITTTVASAGTLEVDGSAASGAITADGSNNTGVVTLTGGSGADTLTSGSANDVLTGGAGNDTLTSDAGNDTLTGGAGNDTLVPGAGTDTVNGGAGNDTITLAGNWSASDSIDGGDGTDTATISLTQTTAPTLTNVETVTASFLTGGALNASGIASLATLNLQETTDGTAA